jgi:hypothetical protein
VRSDNTLDLSATLAGTNPAELTSPLQAISAFDTALNRSLVITGLYDEFDVARRALRVTAEPTR